MTCGGIPAIPFVMIKIIWIAFLGAVLKWQPLFYVRELLGGKKRMDLRQIQPGRMYDNQGVSGSQTVFDGLTAGLFLMIIGKRRKEAIPALQ